MTITSGGHIKYDMINRTTDIYIMASLLCSRPRYMCNKVFSKGGDIIYDNKGGV